MKPSPMLKSGKTKLYVRVNSDIDKTGYMQPRAIILDDDRRLVIDQVSDFRPASAIGTGHIGDCYTILIHGKQRYLFFERTAAAFHSTVGRWFFEVVVET